MGKFTFSTKKGDEPLALQGHDSQEGIKLKRIAQWSPQGGVNDGKLVNAAKSRGGGFPVKENGGGRGIKEKEGANVVGRR